MMRSLYSGISGLRVHQTRMDVVGQNLANVNTVGFKSSRVTFRDVLYQTTISPLGANTEGERGGVNPSQIGLGVMIGSIDVLNTRAGPMLTDKPTDVYLDGEGFFMVQALDGNTYYTRVGDFRFDGMGQLVDGNGSIVMGVIGGDVEIDPESGAVDEVVPLQFIGSDVIEDAAAWASLIQFSIGLDGEIKAYNPNAAADESPIITLGYLAIAKFTNPEGLEQYGNSYWQVSRNSGDPADETSNPSLFFPGYGVGKTISNRLEMSNVELAREFTDMIVTQRGFQANSRIITVSDEMLQELVNLKR